MTREELNRAICELRGECWHETTHTEYGGDGRMYICDSCKVDVRELEYDLRYLESGDAMIELLLELNLPTNEIRDNPALVGCGVHGWRLQKSGIQKTPQEAVAIEWYLWKTGTSVELAD